MKALTVIIGMVFLIGLGAANVAAGPEVRMNVGTIIKSNKPAAKISKLPDLVISSVAFEKVVRKKDIHNNEYWIFNVRISVKNRGHSDSGPFSVLLERNVGPGGQYVRACPPCIISVPGLSAHQTITLSPRQFNNANNFNSSFRATADIRNTVKESRENNNTKVRAFVP